MILQFQNRNLSVVDVAVQEGGEKEDYHVKSNFDLISFTHSIHYLFMRFVTRFLSWILCSIYINGLCRWLSCVSHNCLMISSSSSQLIPTIQHMFAVHFRLFHISFRSTDLSCLFFRLTDFFNTERQLAHCCVESSSFRFS